MSGECKSYRLNEPMKWAEFKEMPDDIQETYLKILREKYDVSDTQLSKMFGTSQGTCCQYLKKKGFSRTGHHSGAQAWDKEGFYAWAYGVPKTEEYQSVQEKVDDDISVEEAEEILGILDEEPYPNETEEENPAVEEVDTREPLVIPVVHLKAIPTSGNMTFNCCAADALKTVTALLRDAHVRISISWETVED